MGGGVVSEDWKHPLWLAFEAREGEMVGWDYKQPLRLAFEAREGMGGGGVVGEDWIHPLQLAFEAREGERVVTGWVKTETPPPTHTWSEGGGTEWVETTNDPSDSHLQRGRGMGGGVVGEDWIHPLRLAFEAREGERWSTCAANRSVLPHLTLNKLYQTLLFWTELIGGLEYNTQNIKNTLIKNALCAIFKSLFYRVGWLWTEIVITNALFEPNSPWQ